MEFIAALLLLYGAHCLVHLPNGSVLFARRGLRFARSEGPGWRFTNPIPSSSSLVGERLPWIEYEGVLYARGVAPRSFTGVMPEPKRAFDPESAREISANGCLIRIDGAPFARAATEAGAERVRDLLASAAGGGRDDLHEALAALLADELSLSKLSGARENVSLATGWLRWMLDVYGVALLIALPIAVAWIGTEPALWRGLPAIAALHLACLVAFGVADRRLRPGAAGDRVQRLFEIALYPPLLLRSFHGLESEVLGRFHPATLAAALLDPEARKRFLRAEIVRAEAAAHQPGATGFPKLELRALERLADEIGESVASLVAAPCRHDPRAESYCPSCHAEYRRASGICVDCQLPLRRYAAVEIETQLERT